MTVPQQVYDSRPPALGQAILMPIAGIACPGELKTGLYSRDVPLPTATAGLSDRAALEALADTLEHETLILSSPSQIAKHAAIGQFRTMSLDDIAPQIFRRIDRHPIVWMTVLSELTGENPIPKYDSGRVRAMVRHWRDWARARNLIS
jgi:hypothetical protein